MTKQELVRDMKQFVGGGSFISQERTRKYMGRSTANVRKLLTGLDRDGSSSDQKYFIPDVAQRIIDSSHRGV